MKVKHWIFLLLILVGGLYVFHVVTSHGGKAGLLGGLGLKNVG